MSDFTTTLAQFTKAWAATKLPIEQIWDRDIATPDEWLGTAVTDSDGRFDIAYDPADAGFLDVPDLELRVIDDYNDAENLLFRRRRGTPLRIRRW
jgi:hypothetical protein